MEKYKKMILYAGLAGFSAVAMSCFLLAMRFFDNPRIAPTCMYNAGVDVSGAFVCLVLFFGCIGQIEIKDAADATLDYLVLLSLTSVAFIVNELSWYLAEMPGHRTACLALNSVAEGLDIVLTYFFFRYVRKTLSFEGKLARWLDHGALLLLIPSGLLILVNLFVPICFSVDAEGVFRMERLYRLLDLYLVIVAPLTAVLIFRSKAVRRQKAVALSFIVIPILHYLITGGAFNYATQYASTLLSLIMMYCVLFTDRSKKLAATQTELKTATSIQTSMLPQDFPPFPDRKEFDLYAEMDPAREVGGDFYDFFLIDQDHLCLVIADVSGKGVPAALFMMVSKIILASCAMLGESVADILKKTNEAICSNDRVDMFVTVWLGVLEISTGKLTAANAGHEYPALKQAGGPYELYKDRHGLVIGGMAGTKYREYEIQLQPGDQLFVYTDGVPEATNSAKELFGTDRMLEALNADPSAVPEQVLRGVRRAVDGFVKNEEQFDDLTMLCLEYRGSNQA